MSFKSYVQELSNVLLALEVSDSDGEKIDSETALDRLNAMCLEIKEKKNTIFFAGNGASAMMASHMATDFCKNGSIKSMAFNDASLMTAIGNDISYEQSFAFPLKRFGQSGDMLVTISSSGNSPNILASLIEAKKMGVSCITLSGMKEDNKSRQLGDLNFYVPGLTYGLAESAHQVLLHWWFDRFMELTLS